MKPRICVAVPAYTEMGTLNQMRSLRDADLIEIRFDYRTEKISPEKVRTATDKPLIATNRIAGQGGQGDETEETRIQLLLDACRAGFEYIDVELEAPNVKEVARDAHVYGAKCIVSHHDFDGTPTLEELREFHGRAVSVGADLVKLIGTANSYGDNLVYFRYLEAEPGNVSFGMGRDGAPSRVMSALLGGAYTYASASTGKESASGQLTLQEMRRIYRAMRAPT
ncbi:type I 3-dehydroquinate dehydratase [Candidatus Bathyarchaeota archaeon]|nr:type I 3-dehydroquinate dehydratase [Candidatus Bathyarchaeota archaeon]